MPNHFGGPLEGFVVPAVWGARSPERSVTMLVGDSLEDVQTVIRLLLSAGYRKTADWHRVETSRTHESELVEKYEVKVYSCREFRVIRGKDVALPRATLPDWVSVLHSILPNAL